MKNTPDEKENKVFGYIKNYILEVQRHFDITDRRMCVILYKIYRDFTPLNSFKKIIQKQISMIKSFHKCIFKR